jgi:oxalate decarboxylase
MAHTPPEVLAKNFGVAPEAFKGIPLTSRWIFQGKVPPPLDEVKAQIAAKAGVPEYPFTFSLYDAPKISDNRGGSVQIADSTNFHVSKTIAAGLITLKPGAMRTMHWHPNADEWQYYMRGQGRMTVFNAGPAANTANFHPGDIGYVPKGLGHYIENTGSTDLVFIAVFRSDRYEEVSFSDWLAHSPHQMVAETFNLELDTVAKFPRNRPDVMPE